MEAFLLALAPVLAGQAVGAKRAGDAQLQAGADAQLANLNNAVSGIGAQPPSAPSPLEALLAQISQGQGGIV